MQQNKTKQARIFCVAMIAMFLLLPVAHVQAETVAFDSGRWTMISADTSEYLGRKCLSGIADLADVVFTNGIIEFDIAVEGECIHARSYPGFVFRKQSPGDYERFYIRPHRSGLYTDALQYSAVFNNIAGWQLYNGDGATAGIQALPANQWFHLKAEISGKQCKIYVNDAEEPNLVISDLKHGVSTGSIGLFGPPNVPVYFSNFQYTIDENLSFDPPPEITTPYGMITEWELSPPFKVSEVDFELPPDRQGITDITWQRIQSDPSGLVDIARYTGQTSRAGNIVWARTTIHADLDEVREFQFGYSDAVTVFCNGEVLFSGSSSYQQRDPSFLGIIGLFDAVYLPLKQGDNELLLAVFESFGGWGLMCRDADAVFEHEKLTKTWELKRTFKYPESIVYDDKRNVLYISNYYNDGQEFISKVSLNGEIETLEWITGVDRPTGMYIYRDTLYVAEQRRLAVIDLDAGTIVRQIDAPGAQFLNDIVFDASGNGYITDSRANAVYKYANGEFEIWLQGDEINDPNGVLIEADHLILGNSNDGCLKSINLSDKTITTIVCLGAEAIMDGVASDGRGNFIISDFNGRMFLVTLSGEKTQLLDTSAPGIYCADFVYIPKEKLIIVPTLYENRVAAYTYIAGP